MKTEKLIHYSRDGYEGNYTYKSVCGKDVKTHQELEGSTIYPNVANCKDCLDTEEWKQDTEPLPKNVINRIHIESDFLHSDGFRSVKRSCRNYAKERGEEIIPRVFSKVIDLAWHKLDETWEAIKQCDEVWAETSLIPLAGGYTGAPVIFDAMCKKAIEENLSGKKIFILNNMEFVSWHNIDIEQMKKAFVNNKLFMYNDDYDIEEVDITNICI